MSCPSTALFLADIRSSGFQDSLISFSYSSVQRMGVRCDLASKTMVFHLSQGCWKSSSRWKGPASISASKQLGYIQALRGEKRVDLAERYKAQYESRLVLIPSILSPFSRNKVTSHH